MYSSGLFPFFQFASVPNKSLFLNNIIRKHYLEIADQELALALPGFLVSILPGLDEQNEALIKTLKEIFERVRSKVGESHFFGVLWTVILRTHRIRLAGIKYLNDAVPTYKVVEKSPETIQNIIDNFFPNMGVLTINSLISVMEDDNIIVQRFAMDFVMSRFPINNQILNEPQKLL